MHDGRRPALLFGNDRGGSCQKGDNLTECAERADLFRTGCSGARQPLLNGREDLDSLDRINSEVRSSRMSSSSISAG